jgi:uncharacterized protein with PIN domain
MRFLVDECLSRSLVDELRRRGHDVRFIREETRGIVDGSVLAIATADQRLLISEDRDFGLLTVRDRQQTLGVIIVAASSFGWPSTRLARHVADTLSELGKTCIGSLTTIEPGRIRQRTIE